MKRAGKPIAFCLGLALAGSILVFAATHAGTNHPSGRGPHLTVHFIQTTEQSLATLEQWLGFSLDPQAGRAILTSSELQRVTNLLDNTADFETLGTHTFDLSTTNEHTLEPDRKIAYATEFKRAEYPEGESSQSGLEVEETQEKGLGFHGTICVTVVAESAPGFVEGEEVTDLDEDGWTPEWGNERRYVVLSLERTELTGWKQFSHEGVRMPCFKNWSIETTLLLGVDEAAILVNRPYNAFEESAVFSKDKPSRDKVFLIIISLESPN